MGECPKCYKLTKSIIEEFGTCSKCVPENKLKKWILGEWYGVLKDCSPEERISIFKTLIKNKVARSPKIDTV